MNAVLGPGRRRNGWLAGFVTAIEQVWTTHAATSKFIRSTTAISPSSAARQHRSSRRRDADLHEESYGCRRKPLDIPEPDLGGPRPVPSRAKDLEILLTPTLGNYDRLPSTPGYGKTLRPC